MMTLAALLATLALSPANAVEVLDFSGQGVPRETADACQSAGQAIATKLAARAFERITLSCAGTSQAIGGYVPVVRARSPRRYTTVQSLSGRFATVESCAAKLAEMATDIPAADVLEKECLRGNEVDFLGKSTPYFQPWITRLVLADDQRHSTTEGERREVKQIEGQPEASSPAPGSSGSQRPIVH